MEGTYVRHTIDGRDDDPPERLELDLVRALFERGPELLGGGSLGGRTRVGDERVRDGVGRAHSWVGCRVYAAEPDAQRDGGEIKTESHLNSAHFSSDSPEGRGQRREH